MMKIKKTDMADRVARATESAPDISDRLRHAQALANANPAVAVQPAPKAPPIYNEDGSRFLSVPIELVDPNPYNARKIYRPERVNELAASIGAHGQDVPGIATDRDGRYILAAGHYRWRAIKLLGLKTMDLMVHSGLSDKDLFAYSYRENAERESQTALDNALSWDELLRSKLYQSETELAEVTGMSLPNINKTLRILTLSAPVLDLVKEDPAAFALSTLYELALFESAANLPDASLDLAKLIKDGQAGRKEIQEARSRLSNQKQRKVKETSRQYKIQHDGQSIGFVKSWDSGRVALDVTIADPTERNEILELLKNRFGIAE